MPDPFANSPEFQRLVQGHDQADWTLLALELARDAYPELDPQPYLERLDALAAPSGHARQPVRLPRRVLHQINWVLFVEEGYRGNTDEYDDPRNSYLNEVMDRRLGIPISLSVLYQAVAARAGLTMAGVNLPGHFVLRTGAGSAPLFVDPFHEGAILDREGCRRRVEQVVGQRFELSESQLEPCSTLALVSRMLRNLKRVYVQEGDFAAALPVQRRLAALARADAAEARDLGVIALRAGFPGSRSSR